MLLGTLGVCLLGNLLTGKGTMEQLEQVKIFNATPSFNFEIQKHYENQPKFNGFFSRNNLSKTKDGEYINLDDYESIETHWIALYVHDNNVTYFDSFGIEHIPKEIRKLMGNKNIINIYRIQAYDLIIGGYFCIVFIGFMLKGKSLLEYTNFLLMIMRRMTK